MCGRYIITQKVEVMEKRFGVKADFDRFDPNYNVSLGQYAPVITNKAPRKLQLYQFGLTPFWAKKQLYLINARSEGDRNKSNDPAYSGGKEIINKPAFRKAIRSQRCLVIADAFIEGSTDEGLDKPYLVYLKNKQRPFAFAGIWDVWFDEKQREEVFSFSIITSTANSLLQKIPHHRSPVILPKSLEYVWLSDRTSLSDISSMLHAYPSELMNAYPIDSAIKTAGLNSPDLIVPKGERLEVERMVKINQDIRLQGMGARRKRLE